MNTLRLLISSLALLTLSHASFAQDTVDAAAQEQAGEDARLVKVATLASVEANQEFQRNVRIMQMAREQAMQIKQALEKETDETKKKELEAQLEKAIAELTENNQQMIKHYGFSLSRNYVMVVEKSHVYMQVTEEEAEKIAEELREQEAKNTEASK